MTNQHHVWQILDDVMALLAANHWPTPERTYKLDGGWGLALGDLKRFIADLRAKLAAAEETEAYLRGDRDRLRFELTESIAKTAAATERAEKAEAEREAEYNQGFRQAFAEVAISIGCDMKSLYKGELWAQKVMAIEAERDALRAEVEFLESLQAAYNGRMQAFVNRLKADRDALAKQNASLRAAIEAACPVEPMVHYETGGCMWCGQGSAYAGASASPEMHAADCGWRIGRSALALTPPAALDDLRRRERSIGAEEELRRIAGLNAAVLMDGQDLLDRADAIAAERKEGE